EDVGGEPVRGDGTVAATAAVGRHRVDAELGELELPSGPQRRDLGDGAADAVDVETARDRAHVRQLAHRGEATAAEVEAVETDLLRGVRQSEARDAGPQRHRLARLRAAGDGEVAAGAG